MHRPKPVRAPQSRRQLGFEPLETREMLFADAGIDWWSAWDAPVVDDWSWTFADAGTADTGGDAAWNDAWWVGDSEQDDAVDSAYDAGGFDWTAGLPDAGAGGDADPGAGAVDAATGDDAPPPDAAPPALGEVNDDAGQIVAEIVTDPIPETPTPPTTVPDPVIEDVTTDASADDEALEASPPPVTEPTTDDAFEPTVVEDPVDVLPEPEEIIGDPSFDPPQAVDTTANGAGAVPVRDDPATPTDDADEPVAQPTTVVVTPVASDPSAPVPVVAPIGMPPASASPATSSSRGGFAAWGAIFFQAFGRPADGADGGTSTGEPVGQTGSGRPRVRPPARPRG